MLKYILGGAAVVAIFMFQNCAQTLVGPSSAPSQINSASTNQGYFAALDKTQITQIGLTIPGGEKVTVALDHVGHKLTVNSGLACLPAASVTLDSTTYDALMAALDHVIVNRLFLGSHQAATSSPVVAPDLITRVAFTFTDVASTATYLFATFDDGNLRTTLQSHPNLEPMALLDGGQDFINQLNAIYAGLVKDGGGSTCHDSGMNIAVGQIDNSLTVSIRASADTPGVPKILGQFGSQTLEILDLDFGGAAGSSASPLLNQRLTVLFDNSAQTVTYSLGTGKCTSVPGSHEDYLNLLTQLGPVQPADLAIASTATDAIYPDQITLVTSDGKTRSWKADDGVDYLGDNTQLIALGALLNTKPVRDTLNGIANGIMAASTVSCF